MDEYIKDTWSDEVFEKYFINGMIIYLGLSVARDLTQFTGSTEWIDKYKKILDKTSKVFDI